MKIYHITSSESWQASKDQTYYIHPSLEQEGFIHCSYSEQLSGVANRFFKGVNDLLILVIDPQQVRAKIIDEAPLENPQSTQRFPHIYGPLETKAVLYTCSFPCGSDGQFELPKQLLQER